MIGERGCTTGENFNRHTMCDINDSFHTVHSNIHIFREIGWTNDVVPYCFQHICQGILHVDDMVAFSCIYCVACTERILKATLPEEIGLEREWQSPATKVMASDIRVDRNSNITVMPMLFITNGDCRATTW